MEKTIYSSAYAIFLDLLRAERESRGLTQQALAERLKTTQTQVSKIERGERRLDVLELHAWCKALEMPMSGFVSRLEETLDALRTASE